MKNLTSCICIMGLSGFAFGEVLLDQIGPDDGSGIGTGITGCQNFEATYDVYDIGTLDNFAGNGETISMVEMVLNGWNGFVDPSSVTGYTANLHSDPSVAAVDLMGDIGSSSADAADATVSGTWAGAGWAVSMPSSMTAAVGTNWVSMIPTNEFATGGQTGVADSNLGDGTLGWQANPGGGFGMPGNMQEMAGEAAYRVASDGVADPCGSALPQPCPADLDGDGQVAVPDILIVIGNWGDVGDGTYRPAGDCAPLPNGNCATDVADVLAVVASWGADCAVYGACCIGDGTCNEGSTAADCAAAGGTYFGDNSSCADGDCSVLACCLADMSCVEVTADSCAGLGGTGHAGDDCTSWDCTSATPGDECADAIAVYDGANAFDITDMTPSAGDPNEADCAILGWVGQTVKDGWYSYVATGGTTNFDTCDSASYDTSMVLYEGDCTTQVACNGDAADSTGCQPYHSVFDYDCIAGTTYYVRMGGWNGAFGAGTLTITVAGPPVPGACCIQGQCQDGLDSEQCAAFGGEFAGEGTACDDDPDPCAVAMGACCRPDQTCYEADATTCAQGGNVYYGDGTYCADTDCAAALPGDECSSATVATLGANAFDTSNMTSSTPEPDEAMCAGTFLEWMSSPDAWMMFTADSSAEHTFTTCDANSYDTSMVLYEGDCNTQVACNGDSSGGTGCQAYYSEVAYNCTAGETYYVRLGGWQAATGAGTVTITSADPTETAACCDFGACLGDLTSADCAAAGGNWVQGESCGTYACPQPACPGAQVSQNVHTVDDSWSAGTSTNDPTGAAVYERAESVNLASMTDLSVWGLQLYFDGAAWGACTTDYGFNVRAYDDAGGSPGAMSAEALNAPAVKTATGDLYAGLYEGFRWDIDFPASNVGWLGVQSESDGLGCWFLWMSSGIGDGSSAVSTDGGAWDMSYAFDLAICVN
jgi:hypothetical protein